MIQRIQTVYLLLAALLVGLLFFFPLAGFVNSTGTSYIFRYRGLYEISGGTESLVMFTLPLAITLLVSALLSLISVFLFKLRSVQMKMSILNIIVLFMIMVVIAYYAVISFEKFGVNADYTIFATMPIIALILHVMAFYAIRKDERLVKSIDRIR